MIKWLDNNLSSENINFENEFNIHLDTYRLTSNIVNYKGDV